MSVHLRRRILCSRAVTSHMTNRGSGAIINVCSQLGYIGRENYTAYSVAKGGLVAFTAHWLKSLLRRAFALTAYSAL